MAKRGDDSDGLGPTARAERSAGPYLDAMWRMVGALLVGALLGWLVDRKLATSPWGLVVGLGVGLGAGFWSLLVSLSRLERKR